jgi:hypothetical protein
MTELKGAGERAEHARSRTFWTVLAVCGALGGIVGGAMVIGTGNRIGGDMTAGWAIAAALLYGVGVVAASWYFFRIIDEVELRDNLIAATVAVYFYTIVYPVWYLLWKGGLIVEPIHEAIFFATLIAMTIAYFWKKLRP